MKKSTIEAVARPAPFQDKILKTIRFKRDPLIEHVKHTAAQLFSCKPKPTRCMYSESGEVLATFRYLDEDDYRAYPQIEGVFNVVVTPTFGKPPYLHSFINLPLV